MNDQPTTAHFSPESPGDLLKRLAALLLREPEQAERELLTLQAAAVTPPDLALEAQVTLMLAHCSFYQGQYALTRERAATARALAKRAGLTRVEARALVSLGLVSWREGSVDDAVTLLLDSLQLAKGAGDQDGVARALENIGVIYGHLGGHQKALALHEQGLEVARSSGLIPAQAHLLVSLLSDHLGLHQYENALALADEAVAFAYEHGLARFEAQARVGYARLLVTLGRSEAGLRMARAGLKVTRLAHDAELEARLHWVEGMALMHLGDLKLAALRLHASQREHARLGYRLREAEVHATLGQLYAQWDAHGEAQREAQQEAQGKHGDGGHEAQAAFHQQEEQRLRQSILGDTAQRVQAFDQQFQALSQLPVDLGHSWQESLDELTHSLKRARIELSQIQNYDLMTEALSRNHILHLLSRRLMIQDSEELLGVIIVNVDHMRTLNSLFGQSVGDHLLAEVVRRLKRATRLGDMIGRLGGDEFVVVLNHLAHPSDLEQVMNRCQREIAQPYQLLGQQLSISASLGGVLAPQDGTTAETLLRHADLTVRRVKQLGRNTVLTFQSELIEAETQRRMLEYDLRSAISRQELRLHYQAICAVGDQRVVGYEALIRWQHPRLGLLGPGHFIEIAEHSRSILDIGKWVMNEACAQARVWGLEERGISVAVNVSPLQFSEANFVETVRAALERHGLQGRTLVLEITESVAHQDEALTRLHLAGLRATGVQVAIDDFGSGFSNLSLLSALPFQILKLDRSLLRLLDVADGAAEEEREKAVRTRMLIEMVIALAHGLKMRVVVEGVETARQFGLLRELLCDEAQGFWLARPLPPEQVPQG